jgi:Ca2+-binding RTX toxin-like protein
MTAPTANPDFTRVVFGQQDIVAAPGVLANDIPGRSNDKTLTVSAVNGSAANVGQSIAGHYGSLQLFGDGHFIYTASGESALPSSGVSEDFFGYTALEGGPSGGGSASSTLTVVVIAPGLIYLGGKPHQTIQGPNGHSAVLDGSAGNDILLAGNGAHTVLVGGDHDSLTGNNKGSDTYVFMGPFGQNTITNFNPKKDIIQLDHNEFTDLNAVKLAATQPVGTNNTVITDHAGDTVTLVGVSVNQLHFDAGHFLLA